jgi:hypothetical protein
MGTRRSHTISDHCRHLLRKGTGDQTSDAAGANAATSQR